jgi:phosphoglycolate phosphatase-like HAD superfamily hydrolase
MTRLARSALAESPADRPVDAVVFDLDGTLVDTAPDIANAVNRLLATHGLPPQTVSFVEGFIGEGSFGLVEKLGGLKSEVQHLFRIRCCDARKNSVSTTST